MELVFLGERLEEALMGFWLDLLMNLTLVSWTASGFNLLKVFVAQHPTVRMLQQRAHRPVKHAAVAVVSNPALKMLVFWTKAPVLWLNHDVSPTCRWPAQGPQSLNAAHAARQLNFDRSTF